MICDLWYMIYDIYIRYLWNLPHGIYPQNTAVSLSQVREMPECRCFFFPPGCDSTRDDLSRDFGDVVIPPCCIPFCILAQRKVAAFVFFVECKGQKERSRDNIRWLWFLLELSCLTSCFVVYKFVGLKKKLMKSVEAFFQWYKIVPIIGTWSFFNIGLSRGNRYSLKNRTWRWIVFQQSIHEVVNLFDKYGQSCCKFLAGGIRHCSNRGHLVSSSWVVMLNVDFLKSYLKNFKESHVHVIL